MPDVPPDAGVPPLHGFIARQFHDLVRNPGFPCTIARGSAAQDRIGVHVYGDMRDPSVATPLLADLYAFIGGAAGRPRLPQLRRHFRRYRPDERGRL